MPCLAERVAQPLEAFVQTITGSSAGGLNVLSWGQHLSKEERNCPYPGTLSETVKTKLVRDFGGIHSILQNS